MQQKGFSLVELSIVLVILGLLTGGILAGQSLIRASELRSVSTEHQRFVTAIGTFRDKYFAIPGDFATAASFWATPAATCPGTNATLSTGVGTCNGNGDGQVTALATGTCGTTNCGNEIFRFWHHLANAGLIEGSYSGVPNSATATATNALAGTNVPRGRIGNSGWYVNTIGTAGVVAISSVSFFEGTYNTAFRYGTQNATTTDSWVVRPEEAWNIDTKMDDGKPGTGNVVVFEAAGPTECHDQTPSNAVAIASAASYLLSNSAINCAMMFKTGY